MAPKKKTLLLILAIAYIGLFTWSAITPLDYRIWGLEISGVVLLIVMHLLFSRKNDLTVTTHTWFFVGVSLITVGAHYSFPNVPFFENYFDFFYPGRNNYDKLGHIVQGVVPVLISREILVRKNIVTKKAWINLLSFCVAMTVSGVYELFEWLFVLVLGENDFTDSLVGAQGYRWDAQSDILCALLGATLTILLGRRHLDSIIESVNQSVPPDLA